MLNKISQCDYCAFKVIEDQSNPATAWLVENKYKVIRGIKGAPKNPRLIHAGGSDDRTETCFINSPQWSGQIENIYCPDYIDSTVSLETALDLRGARVANRTARDAKIWAIIATIIATITFVYPYIISRFQ